MILIYLSQLLKEKNKKMDVLMRVTPGVESHTHDYIMTGNEDSKFGFNLKNGQAEAAFKQLYRHESIHLKGLHCHIGSQIFETEGFVLATDVLFQSLASWKELYDYTPDVLNLGGGFGIRYTAEDKPLPYNIYVEDLVRAVKQHVSNLNIPLPEIWIRTRSLNRWCGRNHFIYDWSIERNTRVRHYVSVDGGMADNIRPALYQAKYDAVVANKVNSPVINEVTIAGKACESGDILIKDLPVPTLESGDILAVFSTGAYGYSMASHYNRFSKTCCCLR